PERLVIRHRLAPVRHHEARIDLPRALKCLVRLLVLEIVKRHEPLAENLLCTRRLCIGDEGRRERGGDDFTPHRSAPRGRRKTNRGAASGSPDRRRAARSDTVVAPAVSTRATTRSTCASWRASD